MMSQNNLYANFLVDELLDITVEGLTEAEYLATYLLDENEYQNFFREKMKEKGISSPAELSDDEKSAFFADIKKSWAAHKK